MLKSYSLYDGVGVIPLVCTTTVSEGIDDAFEYVFL